MPELLERLIGWVRGARQVGPGMMPSADNDGTSDDKRRLSSASVFDTLSDEELAERVAAATARLAELGAFEDTASVPMRQLTDAQLDARITRAERELAEMEATDGASTDDGVELTSEVKRSVVRHLDVLDYLIEHPDATIPAAWTFDDERARWSDAVRDADWHDEQEPRHGAAPSM